MLGMVKLHNPEGDEIYVNPLTVTAIKVPKDKEKHIVVSAPELGSVEVTECDDWIDDNIADALTELAISLGLRITDSYWGEDGIARQLEKLQIAVKGYDYKDSNDGIFEKLDEISSRLSSIACNIGALT